MSELSSGTKGAMAELRVSIHLMGLGFHVARMLSPNSPTDLYAAKGRRILRVQVKSTLSLNQLKNLRNGGNDLLAVLVDGELHYRVLDRRDPGFGARFNSLHAVQSARQSAVRTATVKPSQ